MSGHGSGDNWINTDVPPGDPRRKTRLVKAEEGGRAPLTGLAPPPSVSRWGRVVSSVSSNSRVQRWKSDMKAAPTLKATLLIFLALAVLATTLNLVTVCR